MTVTPDILKSLDYAIGYAEAAGGEPLPPDASYEYWQGWSSYFSARVMAEHLNALAAPKPAEAVL